MTNEGYLYGTNYILPGPSEPERVYPRGGDVGSRRNSGTVTVDIELFSRLLERCDQEQRYTKMHAEIAEIVQEVRQVKELLSGDHKLRCWSFWIDIFVSSIGSVAGLAQVIK
jgi:hypothetical protein